MRAGRSSTVANWFSFRQNKLAEILYDSTRVSFTYDEMAGVLKTVNLQSEGFICSIRYRQIGPLVDRQIFRFSEDGMVNARFDYTYDNSLRVTSMQAVINETPLPIDLYQFDDISGKVEQFGKFGVIYYDINQVGNLKKTTRGRAVHRIITNHLSANPRQDGCGRGGAYI